MNQFKKTAIAVGVAQIALMYSGSVLAQATQPTETVVVVTGQRAALNSAQKIKQGADEVVDSIVADDIGKLPDRSVTEVLQRIVGVTIDRTMSRGDPEHFSVEGSGVSIRGLSYVRSELNGRDSFSANGGRSLNFEDVPPELMGGVDVYKNPSAEQIEGSIGGLVNLRTLMPFDNKGFKGAISASEGYSKLKGGKLQPSGSLLLSNRWKTEIGEVGALIDLATSKSGTRTDAFQVEPYYPRTDVVDGKTVWIPKGAQWRTLEFDRKRDGTYGALQWKANNEFRTAVTYFKSKYRMTWDEQAIFAASSPYNIKASADSTYDANGAFMTGTLTDPKDGGIGFGDDVRTATRKSQTTDVAWNMEWRPAQNWTVKADFQKIKAKSESFDSTVATGVQMEKENLDLTGKIPKLNFDAGDIAFLADPKNYHWDFTMEHLDKSVANEKAWRTDVKYDFDHPVLRDLRFGVRMTDRDSLNTNSNPSYNWAAITATWQAGGESWQPLSAKNLAYVSDPRFSGNTNLHTFKNFFNGKASVPSLIFPDVSNATGYPESYAKLHNYFMVLCAEKNPANCGAWKPATFGTDPSGVNQQSEKSKAFYTQLRFGWDDLKYPIDGNVGVRYVRTDMNASGYTTFKKPNASIPADSTQVIGTIPDIPSFTQAVSYDNSYNNVLPSLNLRMKASPELQFRLAMSSGLTRPDFSQLQGYTSLDQKVDISTVGGITTINGISLTGNSIGNPYLKPITSRQIDLTAEYYFSSVGSLTLAVFNKNLKDVVINQLSTYNLPDSSNVMHEFTVTSPINGAKGTARGFEIAYQQIFDKLPGWMSGLGVQANFTFVDSKTKLYNPVFSAYCSSTSGASNLNLSLNGCDTDGRTFGNLPLQGLSRQTYNLAVFYEKNGFSTRLAYNWRSKNLQNVNVNGTQGTDGTDTNPGSASKDAHNIAWGLPTWADAYGQLDGSISYKFTPDLDVTLEASNLTDATYKQLMQQHIGMKGRAWFSTGPRYLARMTYRF